MKKIGQLTQRKRRGGEMRAYSQPRIELLGNHLPRGWKPGDYVQIDTTADLVIVRKAKATAK